MLPKREAADISAVLEEMSAACFHRMMVRTLTAKKAILLLCLTSCHGSIYEPAVVRTIEAATDDNVHLLTGMWVGSVARVAVMA